MPEMRQNEMEPSEGSYIRVVQRQRNAATRIYKSDAKRFLTVGIETNRRRDLVYICSRKNSGDSVAGTAWLWSAIGSLLCDFRRTFRGTFTWFSSWNN